MIGVITTEENLSRGIYNAMRLIAVSMGRLPDRLLSSTQAEWKQAIVDLRATMPSDDKDIIDIFSVGSPEGRNEFMANCIYINYKGYNMGDKRGGNNNIELEQYDSGGGVMKYRKLQYPDQSRNINYDIRFTATTVRMRRIIETIIERGLGQKRSIQSLKADYTKDQDIFLRQTANIDLSGTTNVEVLYKYTAYNIFVFEPDIIETAIPRAIEITPVIGENEALISSEYDIQINP